MAASVDATTPPPAPPIKDEAVLAGSLCSPQFSPSSDERFWSDLRNRVDVILDKPSGKLELNVGEFGGANCVREDSLLLQRGFDCISRTLSQLSNDVESALQGARDLAQPPTLTEVLCSELQKWETEEEQDYVGANKGKKRKHDTESSSGDNDKQSPKDGHGNRRNQVMRSAKNLAIAMSTKAATLARELKSVKSGLCFMQERCTLLEEENRKLRQGFERPEEDDLVRLQLEALLAEKSRLANENANLVRENQCLHQLVEYHQLTSQDISASYEHLLQGLCLDFSSPLPEEEDENICSNGKDRERDKLLNLSTSLDEYFKEEHHINEESQQE